MRRLFERGAVLESADWDTDVRSVLVLGPGCDRAHFRALVLDSGGSRHWRAGDVDDNWIRDYPWERIA